MCAALDVAIAARFSFEKQRPGSEEKTAIKRGDEMALGIEARALLRNGSSTIEGLTLLTDADLAALPQLAERLLPAEAEKLFRRAADALVS